jgi:PucR family transcriptional regulator, purine catabolism regulatory protein
VLTIGELLRELELQPLAGQESLERPLRWVHISELLDPTPWLAGGELLLTTGMALEDPERQRAFVQRLADHGLAGLGLGLGFGFDATPEAILAAARERELPLFEVPYETPFIAITEKAFARLVSEQYAVLQRSIDAQERLQRIVLSERGLEGLAAALAGLVAGSVVVLDSRGETLVRHDFRRELDDAAVAALASEVRERARAGGADRFVPSSPDLASRTLALGVGGHASAARRPADSGPEAWLIAVKDAGGLSEFDHLVLHHAVTVVALELLRRGVADTTERRLAGALVAELIAGELSGPELVRRLAPFGLGGRVTALVLEAADFEAAGQAGADAIVAECLRGEAISALVAQHEGTVCALLPGLLDDELFALAERVRVVVSDRTGVEWRAGAGRVVAAGEARAAYREARWALQARKLGAHHGNGDAPPPAVATYRDLGSFALLLSLQDSEALALFCDSLVGPIEAGEGEYGGELIRSLGAFIDENGQWERAARRLNCHRHTLRYRMRKIEQLTGRDLSNARDRIEFWLALQGRELIR